MKQYIYIIILVCFAVSGYGQQTVTSSGNHVQNSTHMVSYTLGDVAVMTYSSTTHQLTQGFLQPNASIINGLEELSSGETISIYPNPSIGGDFSIQSEKEIIKVVITNASGQIENFDSGEINTFMSGIIIVSIFTEEGVQRKKLVVQ